MKYIKLVDQCYFYCCDNNKWIGKSWCSWFTRIMMCMSIRPLPYMHDDDRSSTVVDVVTVTKQKDLQ